MTKVLLLEDEESKRDKLIDVIETAVSDVIDIKYVGNFVEFVNIIGQVRFDLVVIDLVVPRFDGGEAVDVTEEIVALIRSSVVNSKATYVAVTQFDDLAANRAREFASLGIAIVEYSRDEQWVSALKVSVQRAYRYQEHDFVVLCALPLERNALQYTTAELGGLVTRNGLNCQTVKIGPFQGAAILLPRMGLVEASVVTTKVIETFRPRLVTIIGICAGIEGRAGLGTILFGDPLWEHQSGKWLGNTFTLEEYHEPMPSVTRVLIEQEIERTGSFVADKADLKGACEPEFLQSQAKVAPMVSGSAVIASGQLQENIGATHKRLSGVDMEMYGVYRAAAKASDRIEFFGVKVVVDLGKENKDDRYHRPGAVLSARVAVRIIPQVLAAI